MCDYEIPELYSETCASARKAHKCCECKSKISKGDKYWNIKGKWDGQFASYKMCNSCYQLGQFLMKRENCFHWSFGTLFEEIQESDLDKDYIEHIESDDLLKRYRLKTIDIPLIVN